MKVPFTHASLFSGIGGFDLPAEWAGWENIFHCEWNEFGKRVLNYYWPQAVSYGDITKTDFTIWRGRIDILTGGFPCQPYSAAGKRLGKEDERHLWPEMLRAIREIQPRWVVDENVRGLTNWNGGLVFDEVQADLEALGYEVTPFLLPACAVNAPHRRDRIWFIAHNAPHPHSSTTRTPGQSGSLESNGSRNDDEQEQRRSTSEQHTRSFAFLRPTTNPNLQRCNDKDKQIVIGGSCHTSEFMLNGKTAITTYSCSIKLQRSQQYGSIGEQGSIKANSRQFSRPICGQWENFPTESPICGGDDEFSDRLDGITFPRWRSESIKAYGNAVVPELVYQIFKAINQYEQQHNQ